MEMVSSVIAIQIACVGIPQILSADAHFLGSGTEMNGPDWSVTATVTNSEKGGGRTFDDQTLLQVEASAGQ